jgi:hypothetical protein
MKSPKNFSAVAPFAALMLTLTVFGTSALAQTSNPKPAKSAPSGTVATPSAAAPANAAPVAPAAPMANDELAPDRPATSSPVTPTKPVETTSVRSQKREVYGKRNALLGPIAIGPTIGVGFPHPIKVAADIKYLDWAGLQVGSGFLPTLKFGDKSLGITGFDARVRIHPFRGSFSLGLAFGSYEATGSYTSNFGTPFTGTAKVAFQASYLAPHVGWRWTWNSGFFVGVDLGWQFTRTPTVTTSLESSAPAAIRTTSEYISKEREIRDFLTNWASKDIPSFTLLQFGWLF